MLPPPDVLATEVPLASLTGTEGGLARSATAAGWTVRATRSLGPRVPRQVQQEVVRTSSLALVGTMGGWRFTAVNTERDGWEVVLQRPGWPVEVSNITALRRILKAQTPAVIR